MATETWVLNETPVINSTNVYNIDFTVDGKSDAFKSIKIAAGTDEPMPYYYIQASIAVPFSDELGFGLTLYNTGGGGSGWQDQAYRTISFNTAPTGDLLTWLQANSVKQSTPKVNIDLTTLSGYESLAAGTYQLGVKSKAANYQDSDLSSTVSFTKLAAPVVTAADTSVTWNAITNADSYDVYVDGELYENTTGETAPQFVEVPVTKDTANNLSVLSNLDQSKVYTVAIKRSHDIYIPGCFQYTNNNWTTSSDEGLPILSQTATSITFQIYGGSFSQWAAGKVLCGTTLATVENFEALTTTWDNYLAEYVCIIEGTLITLADGTTKPIEDIIYDDDILVWNFYEGKFDSAKPCWIMKPQIATEYNLCKFSNGTEVGFVGQGGSIGYHRIYNDEAKAFTHTGVTETPVGTHTFAENKSFPELVSQEVIKKAVRYYNVGTTKHINLFANGILTSSRISNKYAIKDMKYVGERLISDSEERTYIDKALTRC